MMKLADKILYDLLPHVSSGAYEVVIPNWYQGSWEFDLFKLTGSYLIVENEIKISRSDFQNDKKKHYVSGWDKEGQEIRVTKYQEIEAGKRCNRFYYVVPKNLIKAEECPPWAGLIYYDDGILKTVKNAKLIHNNRFDKWQELAIKLGLRDIISRHKLRTLQRKLEKIKSKS